MPVTIRHLSDLHIDGNNGKDVGIVVATLCADLRNLTEREGISPEGVLTLGGARYLWRASLYTDPEGERFVADIGSFTPVDLRARLRLVS